MSQTLWDPVLAAARTTYVASGGAAFAPFPDTPARQPVEPFHIESSNLLQAETGLFTDRFAELRDAVVRAAPMAHWRQTFKDTAIGPDFLERFGCYTIIGKGGAFTHDGFWCWIVYMPPGLYYPWHHHPGEELYIVVAGEAEFHRGGAPSETLREGAKVQHASNQPHAMATGEHPVMCLVAWRNGFETPPIFTPERHLANWQ